MAHLARFRKGWENEHLATFLLSRISFVANPVTVADDVGSDFYCTIFESREQGADELLFPRNSFAIQVKSSPAIVQADDKIEYLKMLELPFFLGIVDQHNLRMSIYSGEYLPLLFSQLDPPKNLQLAPSSTEEIASSQYYKIVGKLNYILRMPLVLELSGHDSRDEFRRKGQRLCSLCFRMHKNISSVTACEYIFELDESDTVMIMAGEGSAQKTFRRNFYLRLAEAFYNLKWIYESKPQEFSEPEFKMFEACYQDLVSRGTKTPSVLRDIYLELKTLLTKNPKLGS